MQGDWHRDIELQNERMREAAHQRALRRALAYAEQQRQQRAQEAEPSELRPPDPGKKSSLAP